MRFALIAGLITAALAAVAVAAPQQIGPVVADGFSEGLLTKESLTLSGPRVYVRTVDGRFEAKAQKIAIQFGPEGLQAGVESLRSATLTGDVWILTKSEPGRSTEARSARAEVDWAAARQAILSGNVRVESADPARFAGPLKLTADKATVSLKRETELAPGEARIRIESDPGKSRIEFTPLAPRREAG